MNSIIDLNYPFYATYLFIYLFKLELHLKKETYIKIKIHTLL